MKFLFFVGLFLSLTNFSFALEPICKSMTGDTLTFRVVHDFGPSYGNVQEHNSIKKRLQEKYDMLCRSTKKSNEIIKEMFEECYRASEVVKKDKHRQRYLSTCDQVNIAAKAFMEGIEQAEKCEDVSSISSLDRSVKDISDSIKKKDVKKSQSLPQ